VHKGPFIHSANANASNANTNENATFERFCHSNRARTRTRKTVGGFRGGSSFTCLRYKIWSFGIMAQVYSKIIKHREDHTCSYVFVRKLFLMSNLLLLCHAVHDSSQFQKSWLLSCPLCCTFFSKLHNLSRLTLVHSFS